MAKYITRSFLITTSEGVKKRVRVYGKTEKEAAEKLMRKKLEYEMGLLTFNSNTTLQRWVEESLETYKKPQVGKAHYSDLKSKLNKVFLSKIGHMKLADVKVTHLQNCLNTTEGKYVGYIKKCHDIIRSIFKVAVEDDFISKDPTLKLHKPQGYTSERRSLTSEEISLFKEVIFNDHRGALFGISLACGLRPQEARALSWSNIDLVKKNLTITYAVKAGTKNTIAEPKSKAGLRTIPIPDWYMPLLKTTPKTSMLVFPNAKGEPITTRAYADRWHYLMRIMDIKAGAKTYRNKIIVHAIKQDLIPYFLRHTYATQLAEKGVDIKTAQYLLGHSSIATTVQIYTHVTQKMIDQAREKINA